MARKNPNASAAAKLERTYGKTATQGRNGRTSPAMANIMQDKKAGRTPTASLMRYAGGEQRSVYVNGQRVKTNASGLQRRKDNMLRRAGSRTYDPASLFRS